MLWIRRFINLFRQEQLHRELDEELASHLEEAVQRGRDPEEARRAFGRVLSHREQSREAKLLPWLDALASDTVFAWRQLNKRRTASVAAILSLALAIGAATTVFRLVDAVLLRTLPVAEPGLLSYLAIHLTDRDGRPAYRDDFAYPNFRTYRDLVADRAELLLIGGASRRQEAVLAPGGEPERVTRQFLSGDVFGVFGLQPVLGRLLTPNDDITPGGHPVAVISYDFWKRRFGRDADVLGRTIRMDSGSYEIVGVAPENFTGTEPGELTDIFLPSMMNAAALNSPGWSWFRIWVRPKPGWDSGQALQPLQAALLHELQDRVKRFDADTPRAQIEQFMRQELVLLPAASGASELQKQYRRPLFILGVLVVLLLLIACANVGNLLTAQGAARAREMALRVSIGARRWRLIQLVLVESALLAAFASALGALFAAWSAPFVVSMLRLPEDPVRIALTAGWRELVFSIALALLVTLFFGTAPALRAAAVAPVSALKGAEDPHSRRRMMTGLLAAQMAFCVFVQFIAGLFVTTFQRLTTRHLGFSADNVLVIDIDTRAEQPVAKWMQAADELRQMPGVESVSLAAWTLLSRNTWTSTVRMPGRAPETRPPYMLAVSPGFFETMRITMMDGRDQRDGDVAPHLTPAGVPAAGTGIVNEAFARTYFDGGNPVGRWVEVSVGRNISAPLQIVGYVRDAAYRDLREPMRPTIFVPNSPARSSGTLMVRTNPQSPTSAADLRRKLSSTSLDVRFVQIQPQSNFVRAQLLRERLLAALSSFFAIVALVLAAIGMYGVLNYSVACRRREIGIRIALGARPGQVVHRVTVGLMTAAALGLASGLLAGVVCGRFMEALLFEVKSADPQAIATPLLILAAAVLLAAVPPAMRAVRIDPARTLKSD